jgi:hypothetical protein
MKTLKVQVSRDSAAVVECPFCRSSRIVDAGKFRNRRDPLKVVCVCRQAFYVSFEWRGSYRKGTYLEGYYSKLPASKEWSRMLIKDKSSTSIGFTTLATHNLREGDKVKVRFAPNDRSESETERTAIVKRVTEDKYVGCEFVESV